MRAMYIDWSEELKTCEVDTTCPYCEGEGKLQESEEDYCEHCEDGYIEPMYNYKYPIHVQYGLEWQDARKKALDCGLFLFEDQEGETWISLTGCGMDLSPNILLCYLEVEESIPAEWVHEFKQDYRAYLSEKDHKRIARACYETIKRELAALKDKKKSISMFLFRNKEMKKRLQEKQEQFNQRLNEASKIEDPLIRGLVGFSALAEATKEVN